MYTGKVLILTASRFAPSIDTHLIQIVNDIRSLAIYVLPFANVILFVELINIVQELKFAFYLNVWRRQDSFRLIYRQVFSRITVVSMINKRNRNTLVLHYEHLVFKKCSIDQLSQLSCHCCRQIEVPMPICMVFIREARLKSSLSSPLMGSEQSTVLFNRDQQYQCRYTQGTWGCTVLKRWRNFSHKYCYATAASSYSNQQIFVAWSALFLYHHVSVSVRHLSGSSHTL